MLTGTEGLSGCCMVLLCRISLGDGIFGPIWVDCRSRSRSSRDVQTSWLVLRVVFECLDLPLYEVIGPGEVGGGGDVGNILMLKKFLEIF